MSKSTASRAFAAALMLSGASGALAAPTTPDDAQKVSDILHAYLGNSISVAPSGEGYAASFDVAALLAPLAASGFKTDAGPIRFTLTPRADGKWDVAYSGDYALKLGVDKFDMEYIFKGGSSASVFDPAIKAFTSGRTEFAATSSKTVDARTGHAVETTRESEGSKFVSLATPAGPGAVDSKLDTGIGPTTIQFRGAGADADAMFESDEAHASAKAVRNPALLALWAWMVAHPNHDAFVVAQDEFRTLAKAALPIFDGVSAVSEIRGIAVNFKGVRTTVADAKFGMALPGLVDGASVSYSLALGGVSITSEALKDWQSSLRPNSSSIDISVSKLNLGSFAADIVADSDFQGPHLLTPEQLEKATGDLLSSGPVTVKVADFVLASDRYRIDAKGSADLARHAAPSVNFKITASGLDAIQDIITKAAQSDKQAQGLALALAMARGMAKVGPDGGATWVVALADGKMTVNGQPIGGKH